MKILGIETSCDETAAAVVEDGYLLRSNVVFSSMDLHAAFGGVVPEIAARSHIEAIMPTVQQALDEADCTWDDIDAIAVTYGAGLGGSLLVGVMTARTLALTKQKPLYAANHVMGHVYANFLTETTLPGYQLPDAQPLFPLLAVIVSGGHSQLALFRNHFDYSLLGQTRDDAIGEAFDKVAKIIGLPYPGGPTVSKKALDGNPLAYSLPKPRLAPVVGYEQLRNRRAHPLVGSGVYDFSYSGLKTAVLRLAQSVIGEDYTFPSTRLPERLSEAQKADIAASFQRTAVEIIVDKALKACEEFTPASVVIAGGVAANQELRQQLRERLPKGVVVEYTDLKLCTDNGAMIAALGCFMASTGQPAADPLALEISPNLSM